MASMSKKSTTNSKATKNSGKKKMGRPKKQISQRQFEEMCKIQCTHEEICDILGVSAPTLEAWCKETYGETFFKVFNQKRAGGKMSLRRAGYNMAQYNPTVHIFYAKNFLGMTDHVEIKDNSPIERLDAILGNMKTIAEANHAATANAQTE